MSFFPRKRKEGEKVVELGRSIEKHSTKSADESKEKESENKILSLHIHPLLKFLFCAVGINLSYLNYGIVQEHIYLSVASIYKQSGKTPRITTFILLSQALTNTVAAAMIMIPNNMKRQQQQHKKVKYSRQEDLNHGLLLLTSISYSLAMTASNESLYYVSYPAASLAKSCKLVPSMIAGILVERKNYRAHEWFGVFCLTSGIILFQKFSAGNNGTKDSSTSSLYGLILLFMSLFMDGVLGWCQGLLKKKTTNYQKHSSSKIFRPPTSIETMLWTNLYSILFFFPYAVMTGQLGNGMALLNNKNLTSLSTISPTSSMLLKDIMLLATLAASGQFFIFYTIQEFSPIVCATITTTRKFFTILASVYKYGHVLSFGQWASVGLVFFGLYVQIFINLFHSSSSSVIHNKR